MVNDLVDVMENLVADNLRFCCCPVRLSRALYGENAIEESHLDRVLGRSALNEQRQEVQRQMSAIIGSHPNIQLKPLRTFGTLLMRFGDFANGNRLLQLAYDNMPRYSRLESDGDFAIRGIESHNEMVVKVLASFSTFDLSCVMAAYEPYPEIHYEMEACQCTSDAATIVCDHLSVLNLFYIEQVSQKFNLESIIEEHSRTALSAFYRLPLNDVLDLNLMPNFKQELLLSEELCIRVEWDLSVKTCSDVKTLLQVSFPGIYGHLMPYSIVNVTYGLVIIKCYAPKHIHDALRRSAKDNEEKMKDKDTLSVSIGDAFVWKRDKKVESQFVSYQEEIKSLKASISHKEADIKQKDFHIKDLMEINLAWKHKQGKPLTREEEVMHKNMKAELDFLNDKCRRLTEENKLLKETLMESSKERENSSNQETQRFASVAINKDQTHVYQNTTLCTDIYARFRREIDLEVNRRVAEHTSSIFTEACDVVDNDDRN